MGYFGLILFGQFDWKRTWIASKATAFPYQMCYTSIYFMLDIHIQKQYYAYDTEQ